MPRGAPRISLLMADVDESLDFLALLDGVEDETVSRLVHEMDPHSISCELGDRDTLDILSICDLTSSCDSMASHGDQLQAVLVADDRCKHGRANVEVCREKNGCDSLLKTFPEADSVPTRQNTLMVLQLKPSAGAQVMSEKDSGKKSKSQQRGRWKFSLSQQQQLNAVFKKNMYPSKWKITELSRDLKVPVRKLRNRRWRLRKSQGISGSLTSRGSRTMLPDNWPASPGTSCPPLSSANCPSHSIQGEGSSNSPKNKTKQSSVTPRLCTLRPAVTTMSTTAVLSPSSMAIPICPSPAPYLLNLLPAPCNTAIPYKDSRQAGYNWGLSSLMTGWNLQSSLYWPSPGLPCYLPSSYPFAHQFSPLQNCNPTAPSLSNFFDSTPMLLGQAWPNSSLTTLPVLDLSSKSISSNTSTSPSSFPLSFTNTVKEKLVTGNSLPASGHSLLSTGQPLPSTYHYPGRPSVLSVPSTNTSPSHFSQSSDIVALNKPNFIADRSVTHQLQLPASAVTTNAPGLLIGKPLGYQDCQSSLCLPSSTCKPHSLSFISTPGPGNTDLTNSVSFTKSLGFTPPKVTVSRHSEPIKILASPVASTLHSLCPCRECQRFYCAPSWPGFVSASQPDLTMHSSYRTACSSSFPPVTMPQQFSSGLPPLGGEARSPNSMVATKTDDRKDVSERVFEKCSKGPDSKETKINSIMVELNYTKEELHFKEVEVISRHDELNPKATDLTSDKAEVIIGKMKLKSSREGLNTKAVESNSSLMEQRAKWVEMNFNRTNVQTRGMEFPSDQGEINPKRVKLNPEREKIHTKGVELNSSMEELHKKQIKLNSNGEELHTKEVELKFDDELHAKVTGMNASREERNASEIEINFSAEELHTTDVCEEAEDDMLDVTSVSFTKDELFSASNEVY